MPDGTRRDETVADYAWARFRETFGADAALPDYFVTAQTLSPDDHLAVQAAAQKHIDSSISKTINVPTGISFDAFKDVYIQAFDTGCKGCTTYRPNEIRGAVLEAEPDKSLEASNAEPVAQDSEPTLPLVMPPTAPRSYEQSGGVVYMTKPLDRPEVLLGQTYKIKWPDSDHAFYITINDIEQDGRRRPFEVFINSKNMEAYAWTLALTRMISAVFRRGGDVSFVVHELKAVFDPRGGQWMNGQYVPSLLAAIGEVIERHLVATGFMPPRETITPHPGTQAVAIVAGEVRGRTCPRCGSPALIRQEGCDTCVACGFSRCG
jgi:ribonucleoside-diphosphate reductase alpha chain